MSGNDIAVLLSFLAAAIALAGFAGIVTSIDRSSVGASSAVITFRMRNLVIVAIASVVLALLPILLEALELVPSSLWQFASMIGAIVVTGLNILAYTGRVRMHSAGHDQGFSPSLFATNAVLGTIAVVAQIAGAAGALPGRGTYFLGLLHLLFIMCTLFFRMVHMADEAARAASRR